MEPRSGVLGFPNMPGNGNANSGIDVFPVADPHLPVGWRSLNDHDYPTRWRGSRSLIANKKIA